MSGTNDADVSGDIPAAESYWTAERRRRATPVPLPTPPEPSPGRGGEDADGAAAGTDEPGGEDEP